VPEYAVIDLKLPDRIGLKVISALMALDRSIRIVVLTGYGSIPTAVEAIKLGATYYLAKPANVDDIVKAFHRDAGNDSMPLDTKPMSLSRLEWEYIQRVLQQHQGNVAATARALSMHRRTLQRKMAKRPARS
jgi:two-component system response regulator RegA